MADDLAHSKEKNVFLLPLEEKIDDNGELIDAKLMNRVLLD